MIALTRRSRRRIRSMLVVRPRALARLKAMAPRSVIVSAVRTPFGRLGGALADRSATELGSIAIRGALGRIDLAENEIEYVIMGQVLQAGAGQAPARQAAIGAGNPEEDGADTINKGCAPSVPASEIAAPKIPAGDPPP